MTGVKKPVHSEWYTPYFAPTTVIIAVTVLFVSIEAGKYVGNFYIQRDRAAQAAQMTMQPASQTSTKGAPHAAPARVQKATNGKTHHV